MKVASIRARALDIPFKAAFKHASASREATQSLWVEASDGQGAVGYGEGCPREYVSGESLQSALDFVAPRGQQWAQSIGDVASLRAWVKQHASEIDRHPAAWAAVELALLDLFAKGAAQSVEGLLGLPELTGRFTYTAVIGDGSPERFRAELQRYLGFGFSSFKIKLAGVPERDADKVKALRDAGIAPAAVRADANNLWRSADEAVAALSALDYPFMALEEPLRAGDYAGQAKLASALGCAVILDESFLRAQQLSELAPHDVRWIVNLRISKMGGLVRSLALIDPLAQAKVSLIIGAHVGETSLLTRAALAVAASARTILVAQEGAFGTHLLERDVVDPPWMFGAKGRLDVASYPPRSKGFGLGSLDVDALRQGRA